MKILLVYAPFQVGSGMGKVMRSPPLSLMQLAGMLQDHEVEILDMNLNPYIKISDLDNKIKSFDIIGMTCMTNQLKVVLNLCKIAKKHDVKTVVGGFHPTLFRDTIKYPNIDYSVRGEGEFTFRELIDGIDPKEILGLSYKENGSYHHNEPRPLISNLNKLPYPRKDLLNYSKYHYLWVPADVVETSRGCPYDCNFCCVTKFYCRTYRAKSPLRVIKELAQVPKGTKLIFFVDDNLTLNPKRVDRLCDLLIQYGFHKHLMLVCQTRVDFIAKNPDLVKKMSKAGFMCFFIGFESLKQMSLDTMRKQTSFKQAVKAVKTCHQYGILVFGSFIIGNIGETKEDTLKNFELIKKLEIDFMMTNPLTPFPGTELWDEAVANGWVEKDFKWENWNFDVMMRTPDLTKNEIADLLSKSYKFFYGDIMYFLFGKKMLNMLNPYYWRLLKVAPGFLTNGLKDFLIKV
ncbi:MAG: radical SAM protein [Candidatus Lokiarchaeota archaeon]|nr:radical SAM protein [Candidatus Lokiarchaeota archaeon]